MQSVDLVTQLILCAGKVKLKLCKLCINKTLDICASICGVDAWLFRRKKYKDWVSPLTTSPISLEVNLTIRGCCNHTHSESIFSSSVL